MRCLYYIYTHELIHISFCPWSLGQLLKKHWYSEKLIYLNMKSQLNEKQHRRMTFMGGMHALIGGITGNIPLYFSYLAWKS